MTDLLQVFLLAMTPVGELRLSIPVGLIVFNLNPALVFIVSVAGNMVPAIFILLGLDKIADYCATKPNPFGRLLSWWKNNTKTKHSQKIEKYGIMGLVIFVAIPFPITGAYTAALLAAILNLPAKKSLVAIFAGVLLAGSIVTTAIKLGFLIF